MAEECPCLECLGGLIQLTIVLTTQGEGFVALITSPFDLACHCIILGISSNVLIRK